MKKIKVAVTAILIILVCLMGVLYYKYGIDHHCNNLKRIADDDSLIADIWQKVSAPLKDPSTLEKLGVGVGVIYIRNMDGHLGIDWDALRIPLRHATFEIRGDEVDYKNFDPELVKEIRVGYGYRKHMVFKIRDEIAEDSQHKVNPSQVSYELNVECTR